MKLPEAPKINPPLARALVAMVIIAASAAIACPFFLSHPVQTPNGVELKLINTHDMIQHLAVMQDFDKVLKSGNIYPRWLPDYNNGYGGPWMNFYPPGFYYLASLINLIFDDWILTLFAASIIGFAASGFAFYKLAREFHGRLSSAVGALVYMALPYHVINLYWQGAMPQLFGFVFLPLVLLFAYRLGARGRLRDYAALGLVYGLYLMTHAPVSFLMTYTIAFYALVWAIKVRDWRVLFRVGVGMTIGLMVGAIYWLPAATETRYIQEHFSAMFPYHSSYITLMPVEGFGNLINLSFTLQAVILIVSILVYRTATKPASDDAVPDGAPADERQSVEAHQTQTRLWIILGVVTTVMNTAFSIYISRLLPRIQVATFAWRWLAISGLFSTLVACEAFSLLRGRERLTPSRAWVYRGALAVAIVLTLWVSIGSVIAGALSNPLMSAPSNYADPGFTPLGSTNPQAMPITEPVLIEPRGGGVEVLKWEPGYRQMAVLVHEPSEVRLRTYNFRGWTASIDGQATPISSDGDGAQLISIPPGKHLLEVRLVTTFQQKLGATFFGFGLGLVIGLALADYFAARKEKEGAGKRSWTALLKNRYAIIALAAISIVIVIALVRRSTSDPANPAATGATGQSSASPSRGNLSVGSEARVAVGNRDSIMMAADERALDELVAALSANDTNRIGSLVESGRVFSVDSNTRVRILESGLGKLKVRVLEGASVVMEGWVPDRWVR